MNISFMTFASSDWVNGPVRFKNDLIYIKNHYNFFDKEFIINETDLGQDYQDRFSPYYKDHGFAYFSWKPYSIRQTLLSLNDNDWLFYIDCGCVFPIDRMENFLNDLKNTIDKTDKDGSLMSLSTYIDKNPNINIPNICIVKQSILKQFGLETNRDFLYKFPHWQAGLILIKKTSEAISFFDRWYDFYLNHYEDCVRGGYTDKKGEHQYFLHNGSDQAIMQCMLYNEQIKINNELNFVYKYDLIAHKLG